MVNVKDWQPPPLVPRYEDLLKRVRELEASLHDARELLWRAPNHIGSGEFKHQVEKFERNAILAFGPWDATARNPGGNAK